MPMVALAVKMVTALTLPLVAPQGCLPQILIMAHVTPIIYLGFKQKKEERKVVM